MSGTLKTTAALSSSLAVTVWAVACGTAARLSNVSAKMVRHYEGLGLLASIARTDSGYRQYGEADVRTRQFIKRGRELGFSMIEIGELVDLWHNRARSSAKRIAQKSVDDLAQRIEAMQSMQCTLASLLTLCPGNERPDSPILDDLAGDCCKS